MSKNVRRTRKPEIRPPNSTMQRLLLSLSLATCVIASGYYLNSVQAYTGDNNVTVSWNCENPCSPLAYTSLSIDNGNTTAISSQHNSYNLSKSDFKQCQRYNLEAISHYIEDGRVKEKTNSVKFLVGSKVTRGKVSYSVDEELYNVTINWAPSKCDCTESLKEIRYHLRVVSGKFQVTNTTTSSNSLQVTDFPNGNSTLYFSTDCIYNTSTILSSDVSVHGIYFSRKAIVPVHLWVIVGLASGCAVVGLVLALLGVMHRTTAYGNEDLDIGS